MKITLVQRDLCCMEGWSRAETGVSTSGCTRVTDWRESHAGIWLCTRWVVTFAGGWQQTSFASEQKDSRLFCKSVGRPDSLRRKEPLGLACWAKLELGLGCHWARLEGQIRPAKKQIWTSKKVRIGLSLGLGSRGNGPNQKLKTQHVITKINGIINQNQKLFKVKK